MPQRFAVEECNPLVLYSFGTRDLGEEKRGIMRLTYEQAELGKGVSLNISNLQKPTLVLNGVFGQVGLPTVGVEI